MEPFSDRKYRFIYTHIPKTGGTSVKKILTDKIGTIKGWRADGELIHYPHTTHGKPCDNTSYLTKKEYKDYFKFTFVRHPYEWMMSNYNFGKNRNKFYRSIGSKKNEENTFDINFDDWLQSKTIMNQTDYFCKNNTILVDRVCRLENFEKEMGFVLSRLGLNPDFKPTHLKNSGSFDIQDIKTLNKEQKATIRKICKQDFDLLRYEV